MLRFTLCVIGIYVCFMTWGVVQERVSTTPYGDEKAPKKFRFFVVLNLIQSLIASSIALIYLTASGQRLNLRATPINLLFKYAQVAFFNCIGSPFGYASLKHIDYPTMILGKSCKLVPVMLMNILVYRQRYPKHDIIYVSLITAGASLFMLCRHTSDTSSKAAASSSLWGLFLLGANLAIDGLTNATQDQIFRTYSVTGQHMMFFMNAIGSLLSALYLLLHPYNDELWQAIVFFQTHPAVIRDVVCFGVCGAIGQCFIFYTLQHFGSLRLVTVTVTRKIFTMLLSVFWFNHLLQPGQWFGVVLVFSAIGIEAYYKMQKKSQQTTEHPPQQAKTNNKTKSA